MTKGTRYFMIGSALIVALGVGTGLVAYYNGDLSILRSSVGPEELSYVPSEASALAYARVTDIMNSDFRQKLRQVLPTGEAKDELYNQTGINVETDIDSVLAAPLGPPAGQTGETGNTALALIRGRFDEGRIEALIRQHGGTVVDYSGKRVMSFGPEGTGTHKGSIVFVETGLALLGEQNAVKRAIDANATKNNVTSNADMMKLVSDIHNFQNTAWAVGGVEALTTHANLPTELKQRLPAIDWFAATVHVDGGVSGHLRAEARDDQSATDLRAVVNGAIAAARLVGGKDPKLEALIASLQMSGTGKNVDLAFTVPPEMIDLLNGVAAMKNLHEQHHEEVPKK